MPECFDARVEHKKGPWSSSEDARLVHLVQAQGGAENWVFISAQVGSRTAKQCRERWHQNLKPSLNHGPITAEEGERIAKLHDEMGSRWADIAREIPGRSDNAIKNWWNGGENRRKRDGSKGAGSDAGKAEKRGYGTGHREHRLKRRRTDSVDDTASVSRSSVRHSSRPASLRSPRSISVPRHSRAVDGPLVSPASDRTPSLVSDNGSRLSQSPAIEYTMDLDTGALSRRNSRPAFPSPPSPSQPHPAHLPRLQLGGSPPMARLPSLARVTGVSHLPPTYAHDGLHRLADAAAPSQAKAYHNIPAPFASLPPPEFPLRTLEPGMTARPYKSSTPPIPRLDTTPLPSPPASSPPVSTADTASPSRANIKRPFDFALPRTLALTWPSAAASSSLPPPLPHEPRRASTFRCASAGDARMRLANLLV